VSVGRKVGKRSRSELPAGLGDTEPVRGRALRALKTSAAAVDRLRTPPRGVVVLIYHRVGGGSGLELDLPRDRFEEQMAALVDSGRVTTLDAALDLLEAPEPPALDPVVVTVDDGTVDFVDVAVPVLAAHGVPATLYLATAFVEEQREMPYGAPPVSWNGLRDAIDTGLITIGSHTHTHALLDRASPGAVTAELDTSNGLIEDRLGVIATHFAYPKSLNGSPAARQAVAERFRSAALAGTRPNPYGGTDPQRIARSPIQNGDGMKWFHAKVAGGMVFEDEVRRLLNRVRYSGAQS
jgi:peptidoglycan/xylan/chitin deacetylase (PgdA/CDA1 family)